jgi:hypothetical protein
MCVVVSHVSPVGQSAVEVQPVDPSPESNVGPPSPTV